MEIPLAVAAPALVAGVAYLDARLQLGQDLGLIRSVLTAELSIAARSTRDRLNVFYELESHALSKSRANHPLLMYQGRHFSYKEVYHTALKYGAWLKKRFNVQKNEVVAMDFMNCPQFIFLWMGLWSIGARPAFINYNLNSEPLLHSIRSSGARLLVVEEEVAQKFSEEVMEALASGKAMNGKDVTTVMFSQDVEAQVMKVEGVREPDSCRDGCARSDMAILIYTSGTTGLPKPAVVSWNKVVKSGMFMSRWAGLGKHDRYYSCMPLYHSSNTLLGFGAVLFAGSTLILGRRFSTKTFWQEVRQHEATWIQYVGETCRYLLAAPPQIDPTTGENLDKKNRVKVAFGNGLRPDVWEPFKTRFGIDTIAEFYGSTEGPMAVWNRSSNTFTSGAIGRSGPLISTRISKELAIVEVDWVQEAPLRDPANHNFCRAVPRGEPGELLMVLDAADTKGKFQGYYGNEKATEGKILRDVFRKGDAYFRSGDIVRWDKEGRWWFVDRIGDTFRWRSENVSTAEVGEALGTHPAVAEANVYGVQIPHHDGRAGCAAVELVPAEGEKLGPLMEDLAGYVGERLPKYAVPIFVRVVGDMERTGTNKQQKAGLRAEGVDPGRVGGGMWWLRGGRYVPFGEREWGELNAGKVKL